MGDCIIFSNHYDPFRFLTATNTKNVTLNVPGEIVIVTGLPSQESLQYAMQKAENENKLT